MTSLHKILIISSYVIGFVLLLPSYASKDWVLGSSSGMLYGYWWLLVGLLSLALIRFVVAGDVRRTAASLCVIALLSLVLVSLLQDPLRTHVRAQERLHEAMAEEQDVSNQLSHALPAQADQLLIYAERARIERIAREFEAAASSVRWEGDPRYFRSRFRQAIYAALALLAGIGAYLFLKPDLARLGNSDLDHGDVVRKHTNVRLGGHSQG